MFSQHPYRVRLDWGRRAAREAAERGSVFVIVDVLSFSSAVATAVARGVLVYPCAKGEDPAALAARVDAEAAVRRNEVPARGRFSLSPLTFLAAEAGARVVVSSPNGASCSACARTAASVFAGCLLNASAIARAVSEMLDRSSACATIKACGERWREPGEDGPLRVAIEDYLGAGAILSGIAREKSPEARVCEVALLQARDDLVSLVWGCGSGRQLREAGFGEDVRYSSQRELYDTVPVLRGGRFEAA